MFFDKVRDQFGDTDENRRIARENVHADSHGGPVPKEAWQFPMYSTVKPMRQVKDAIPDPHGDASFGLGEECFAAVKGRTSHEEALEQFPLSYSRFVKGQAELEDDAKTVVRRHPDLLVVIDEANPTERGVLIVRLLWDAEAEKSENELRQAGRDGHVETQRCDVPSLVETLERMADSGGRPYTKNTANGL